MIALAVIDADTDHFIVAADQPMRIEVSLVSGRIVAHVYKGAEVDPEQDPSFAYDGHIDSEDITVS